MGVSWEIEDQAMLLGIDYRSDSWGTLFLMR